MENDKPLTFDDVLNHKTSPDISDEDLKKVIAYDIMFYEQQLENAERAINDLNTAFKHMKKHHDNLKHDLQIAYNRCK